MNIISLFESFVNHLNEICKNDSFFHELEHNISNSTNNLNLDVLRNILESLVSLLTLVVNLSFSFSRV